MRHTFRPHPQHTRVYLDRTDTKQGARTRIVKGSVVLQASRMEPLYNEAVAGGNGGGVGDGGGGEKGYRYVTDA